MTMNYSRSSGRRRKAKRPVRIEETLFPAFFPKEIIAEAREDLFCNEILLDMLKNPNFERAFREELSIERIIEIKKSLGEDCCHDYEEALEQARNERDELLRMLEIKDEEKKHEAFGKACQEHGILQELMRLFKESGGIINVQNMNVQGDLIENQTINM